MKKILFSVTSVIVFMSVFILSSPIRAEEMNTEEIMKILENANKVSKSKDMNDSVVTPQEIMQELRENKEIITLKAEQGEFNNANLNARINQLVSFYKSKMQNERTTTTIKKYTFMQECDGKKCENYALVDQKDLDGAISDLKYREDNYKKYKDSLAVSRAIYNIRPLTVKKTKLEQLEQEMYQSGQDSTNSLISTTLQDEDSEVVIVKDNELIDDSFIIHIKPTSIVIKKES